MSCWLMALAVALAGQLGERYVDSNSTDTAASESASSPETESGTTAGNPFGGAPTDTSAEESGSGGGLQENAAPLSGSGQADATPAAPSQQDEPADVGNSEAQTDSPADESPGANVPDAESLLEACAEPPLSGPLSANAISLNQVLTGASSRAEQTRRVEAYWDLAFAVIEYYVAIDEETEFSALRQAVSAPSELWSQMENSLQKQQELDLARIQLYRTGLSNLLRQPSQDFDVVPADLPFCGAYSTRYEEIFQGRADALALAYSKYIPLAYDRLQQRANQVGVAKKWVYATSLRRSPQSDGTELLQAFASYVDCRREFLRAAKDYNLQIARYTELASPSPLEANRLVTMLIRKPALTTVDPNIRSTTSEQDTEAVTGGEQPAGEPSSSNWNVAPGYERSILVNPTS